MQFARTKPRRELMIITCCQSESRNGGRRFVNFIASFSLSDPSSPDEGGNSIPRPAPGARCGRQNGWRAALKGLRGEREALYARCGSDRIGWTQSIRSDPIRSLHVARRLQYLATPRATNFFLKWRHLAARERVQILGAAAEALSREPARWRNEALAPRPPRAMLARVY